MNNKIIPISPDLSIYIEKFNYEAIRYRDLMAVVNRNATNFSDEEWYSSCKYFEYKCEEAQLSLQFALDSVYDMYKEEIGNREWEIDFNHNEILLDGYKDITPFDTRKASFDEQLAYLYPPDPNKINDVMVMNGSATKNITLQVTDDCNMRCTYCYQHCKGKHSMSFETAKEFIDLILNDSPKVNNYITSTKAVGCIVDFIGGEPLLEIDLINKISDYFIAELFRRKHPWAIRFMFSMTSNGLLYFSDKVQAYLKKHKTHVSYSITIDGNKEVHDTCRLDIDGNGTYDRAIAAALDYNKDSNRLPDTKVTISPDNVVYIYDAVKSLIENGYININMNCVFEKGWNYNHAAILYNRLNAITDYLEENNLLDKINITMFSNAIGHPLSPEENNNWCGGTGLMLALDYKGDMYPCLRYMESSVGDKQPKYIIGNLENGIGYENDHFDRINCMKCITRRSQSNDECFNCKIASGCAWCSAYNYEELGTPDARVTYICPMHKARVLSNIYYWKKRGIEYPIDIPEEYALQVITKEEFERLKVM